MCVFKPPKISVPKATPPAQLQGVQMPKDLTNVNQRGQALRRRRGLWASIMTSPQGVTGAPMTTGGSASVTGA